MAEYFSADTLQCVTFETSFETLLGLLPVAYSRVPHVSLLMIILSLSLPPPPYRYTSSVSTLFSLYFLLACLGNVSMFTNSRCYFEEVDDDVDDSSMI